MQLHAAFPELDVDTVNEFLADCQGDVRQAVVNIERLLGPSSLRKQGNPSLDSLFQDRSPSPSSAAPSHPAAGAADPTADAWEDTPLPTPAPSPPAAALPQESRSPPAILPHLFPVPPAAKQPAQVASRPTKKGAHKVGRPDKVKRGPGAAVVGPCPEATARPGSDQQQLPDNAVSKSPGHLKTLESQPAAGPATPPNQAAVDWEGLLPQPAQPSRLVGLPVQLPAQSPCGSKFDGNPRNPKHARSGVPLGILELLNLPDEAKAALQQPPRGARAAAAALMKQPAQRQVAAAPAAAAPVETSHGAAVEDTSWETASPQQAPSKRADKLEFLQVHPVCPTEPGTCLFWPGPCQFPA